MSVRYIGSKARVVGQIMDVVGHPTAHGVFIDAFCGTGSVAEAAARKGWSVRINDNLQCAVTIAAARLVSATRAEFEALGGYENAVHRLNSAPAVRGFIWREYSPASKQRAAKAGVARMYFTEDNAARIDGMRRLIAHWSAVGDLTPDEAVLLLGDLLVASNGVANIAGTFGCFLRQFAPNALRHIRVTSRDLFLGSGGVETSSVDVYKVVAAPEDVIYYDPPYTKRQYAAYYHLLETIACGDEPEVEGVTGLRPWKDKASPFSYKSRALEALGRLVAETPAERVLLSYSSEGHVPLQDLLDIVSASGVATMHQIGEIGRYRPNQAASENGDSVKEVLIEVAKSVDAARAFA